MVRLLPLHPTPPFFSGLPIKGRQEAIAYIDDYE
jgi:hypothetical protein